MYCRSHQGGSEPLPRVRLQPGTGQDSSTFILLLYLFRSMGLLTQEADDTSRHVEADEAMGPPSALNPGAGGAALRKKRVGRDVRAHHSLLVPTSPSLSQLGFVEASRLHSSRIFLMTG